MNCRFNLCITKYKETIPIEQVEDNILPSEQKELCFPDSKWAIETRFAPAAADKNIWDCEVICNLAEGSIKNANVSVKMLFDDWSKENYVLMPGAVYNGNRFKVSVQDYPPVLTKEDEIGVDIPITITDVPKLNTKEGASEIQLKSGDMATPSVLFYSPGNKKGFALLAEQKSNVGDYGLGLKENEDRSKAEISLSAPAVRVKYKYSMCTMKAKSDDVGFDLSENDEVRLKFRLYFFECENITSLFSYFVNIRKDLSGQGELLNRFTFSSSFDIQQEKYNKYNWQKEYEFYTVGVNDNIFNEWQSGWVGGGMNSYPLLLEGNALSKERALKNLEFAFEKAQAPNGFFYGIVYKGKPYGDCFDGQNDSDWLLIRKHTDVVYFLGKQFTLAERLEIDIPEKWKNGYKKSCDILVRLWKKYHQFGQFVHIKNEEIIIGGSTSAASAPAALALAAIYFKDEEYLTVACEAAEYFYKSFTARGVTCGAPGEACQCPDSESAFAILDSYVVLYETTNTEQWRTYAIDEAH